MELIKKKEREGEQQHCGVDQQREREGRNKLRSASKKIAGGANNNYGADKKNGGRAQTT